MISTLDGYTIILNEMNTVSIRTTQTIKDDDWSYTACIDRFERYFTAAKRSQPIQEILQETIEKLEKIENESDDKFSLCV